jgi:hypothetical protein
MDTDLREVSLHDPAEGLVGHPELIIGREVLRRWMQGYLVNADDRPTPFRKMSRHVTPDESSHSCDENDF